VGIEGKSGYRKGLLVIGLHTSNENCAHRGARILVTGGAGYLGSDLCERLLNDGHNVICLDNFFAGVKDNILNLLDNTHFELMCHGVTFLLYVEVDEIYNLACPTSPIHYQYDPVQTTKASVHGWINILGLAKRTGAKIFQPFISEDYGDPEVHLQPQGFWGKVNPVRLGSPSDDPGFNRWLAAPWHLSPWARWQAILV
jgi:UDP-glucuronate decarboxylase